MKIPEKCKKCGAKIIEGPMGFFYCEASCDGVWLQLKPGDRGLSFFPYGITEPETLVV